MSKQHTALLITQELQAERARPFKVAKYDRGVTLESAQFRPLHRRALEGAAELFLRHLQDLLGERRRVLPGEHVAWRKRRILGKLPAEPHVPRTDGLADIAAVKM